MSKSHSDHDSAESNSWILPSGIDTRRNAALASLAVAAVAMLVCPASAQQTVQVRVNPVRVTAPDSGVHTFVVTNFVDIANNSNDPVSLSVSGVPSGVGASLSATTFNDDGGGTLTLNITNLTAGEHILSLDATGGSENHFLLTLQSGRMWDGDTNFTQVTHNWSDPAAWAGGVVPGAADDVLFTQLGGQTNSSAAGFTNSIVDVDKEIASLRFSQTNGTARFHTILISPGRTLSVTGPKGFKMLRDYTTIGAQMDVNITGPQGKLVVSNASANFDVLIDNQQAHRLNMTGLGTFVADVNRVAFGDYRAYPNFTNLSASGFGGGAPFQIPRRFIPSIRLARTNIIRAVYADPNDYMHPAIRDYSVTFENNDVGTTADGTLFFGITNAFFIDSICLVQSSAQAEVANEIVFNPALVQITEIVGSVTNVITNNCVAYFRGTNGGRMSVFAIADAAGVGASGTSTKGLVDFTRGTLDAMVDRLYLGRDRTNSSDNANGEAVLNFAKGTLDANTAILGFQGNGNNQNVGGSVPIGYARGTMTVSTTAVFVVNSTLELGHTTADPGNQRQAEQGYGQLNIVNGGTVRANTITVGGVTKVSVNNTITLNNRANLVVSNTIAGADKTLATLQMNNGSSLTLHLDGSRTTPYVYVNTLNVVTGQTNLLRIASVANLVIPPEGTNVPLFSYTSGGANFAQVVLPPGLLGSLVANGANQIDLAILANTPKNLVWRGGANSDWDTTSLNWLDLDTLMTTNFVNGDNVLFDDQPGIPTAINLAAPVLIPNSIVVSNAANSYSIGGFGGSLQGSATLTKIGTGALAIDGPTTIAAQVSEGSLTGSGSLGSATVAAGATMNFSGTISSGLTCGGTASVSGNASGGLVLQSPSGTLTNLGNISGSVAMQSGTLLHNAGSLNNIGSVNVVSNATLVNAGTIGAQLAAGSITVNGTLQDTGTGSLTLDTLTINNRGRFIPGGDGIGATIVASTFLAGMPARVTLAAGSTNIFKVNTDTAANTELYSEHQDFGPNQNAPQVNGCTLVIQNLGAAPFSAGQTFRLFKNSSAGNYGGNIGDSGLNTTNSYPFMVPATPGTGLAWDLSNLRIPDGNGQNGIIRVIGIETTPTNMVFSPIVINGLVTTNITGNPPNLTTNIATNNVIIADLSWPTNYIGWRLQQQLRSLENGLGTNWETVFASLWTNQIFITNNVTTNGGAGFFRMIYP